MSSRVMTLRRLEITGLHELGDQALGLRAPPCACKIISELPAVVSRGSDGVLVKLKMWLAANVVLLTYFWAGEGSPTLSP